MTWWIVAAALWGAAEASFFFLVPDILLTAAALRHGLKAGLLLSVCAATLAALTGVALWAWARHDPVQARAAMLHVPAVGPDLLARVHGEFDKGWPLHLTLGAVSGVPYKLYAVEAGVRGAPLWLFVPVSFAARLTRFALTVTAAAAARAGLAHLGRPDRAMPLWACAWILVYAVYFTIRATAWDLELGLVTAASPPTSGPSTL
jgi:membrane protein YqaA with SNARE-associated domain